ncbi:MAG TPA: EAL domain-containing protein, partial [Burkholderiaceae bacterium]|nr:EAL domain-containing protein [Burkholderiaceae bacterium]
IIGLNGQPLCSGLMSNVLHTEVNLSDRPYFERVLDSPGTILGEFYIGRISESPIFLVITALRRDDGSPYAIGYVSLDLRSLSNQKQHYGVSSDTQTLLLDRNNIVLKAHPDNSLYGAALTSDTVSKLLTEHTSGSTTVRRSDGKRWQVSFARTGTQADPEALTIVHLTPSSTILSQVNQALWIGIGLTVLITIITLLLGWWGLYAFVGRNIRYLTEDAKRLGQRTYNEPVTPFITGAEFQAIGSELDTVASELQELELHWETSLRQRQSEAQILRLIANAQPLEDCLTALSYLIQDQIPNSLVAIILLDEDQETITTCVAPNLPSAICTRLNQAKVSTELGWHVQALIQKQAIISNDVKADALWSHSADQALQNHIETAWAYPIIASEPEHSIFGTINIYLQKRRSPTEIDLNLSRMAAGLALIAVTQQRQHQTLQYQSRHDPLTGLFNRHTLSSYITAAIHHAQATRSPFCVLMLDLDGFKEVNNTLGNELGDLLLKQAGQRLNEVVADRGYVGRSGNDEYLILLQQANNAHLQDTLKALLRAMRTPFTLHGVHVQISASIGVACYPEAGTELHSLLQHSESAMYKARREGSGFLLYDRRDEEKTNLHIMTLSGLRGALENSEFVLHFQPKIDLRSGTTAGLEALIRWQHPQKGLISPQSFIGVAELSDIIHPLTLWVIEESVRQCSRWRKLGYPVTVSANLSTRNLLRHDLPNQVQKIIKRHNFPANRLQLEVTESAVMDDINRALPVLQGLRGIGVRLALDDFGTGYSSLAYIRRLPVENLKIDRSFITVLDKSTEDRQIVMTIIKLAHSLRLTVTAEGVENDTVLRILRRMGCNYAQGFGIARPIPAEQVIDWFNDANNPKRPILQQFV